MIKKTDLKQKIMIIFTSFVFLIIFTIISYFYIGGKYFLINQAYDNISERSNKFCGLLKTDIENSENEIFALYTQLADLDKQFSNSSDKEKYIRRRIESFLTAYAEKYFQISMLNKKTDSLIIWQPVRDFSGKTVPARTKTSLRRSVSFLNDKKLDSTIGIQHLIDPDLNNLYLISNNTQTGFLIYGTIKLSNIVENQVFSVFQIEKTLPVFLNKNGQVISSSNKSLINRNIFEVNLIEKEVLTKFQNNSIKEYEKDNILYIYHHVEPLDIQLLIKHNIGEELKELNHFAFYSLLFCLLIFIILVIVIRIITTKFIRNLQNITSVAEKVSEGSFDYKINIERDDELGILINTFNQMIDRLKISYEQFNIVNKELEAKIEELIKTKMELSEKERLALIGETISKISHEIQNKIGGISIWVQNLEIQEGLDETSKLYVNEIKLTLHSFTELLNNFKKFYRKPVLEKTTFSFAQLLSSCLTTLNEQITGKSIKIIVSENFEYLYTGDYKLIEIVFINLIVNAIYYSPAESEVVISLVKKNGNLLISFQDKGSGINPEITDRVFEPFFSTKATGSGLGLAISKNIIEAHGGNIEYKKNNPTGAIFKISLPITKE